jgi:ATP-dependent RNA/DNA helicase IGHMBP2
MDFNEHFSKLQALLSVERKEDRRQFLEKIRNRSIQDRKRDGVCWYPIHVTGSRLGLGEKWELSLERNPSDKERHHFQAGTSASVFVDTGDNHPNASGIISRIYDNKITIMLNREDPPEWLKDGKLGIDLLFDESTYDEMDRTLARLKHVKDGRMKELIPILLGEGSPRFDKSHLITYPHLNESQNEALQQIRGAQDLAIVHGPPGTGKTTTLVQAIAETVDREKQVLVCASSNAAVDLLVEKLHEQSVNVLRLGHPARVNEEVITHTLDAQLAVHDDAKSLKDIKKQAEEFFKLGSKYKRKFGREEAQQRKRLKAEARKLKDEASMLENYMIDDLLNKAQVIACTLVGVNHQHMYRRHFKTIFIDEASQALEPANWIPIFKADRVVMAGDHLQLPPTVKSIEAAREGLGMTLFERSINAYQEKSMLKVQYRMHPTIMDFSNKQFYENKLETAESVLNRVQLFDEPAEFIDTAGAGYQEEINPETLSTFNKEEATFVIDHLMRIKEHLKEAAYATFGIIAPYKAQVEWINRMLKEKNLSQEEIKKISINTVDAFQGQERDVILMSLTRSNAEGIIGFLADERRLNVAMTRARHKLVLVGDSATLASNSLFNQLIEYHQEQGSYHSVFEYLYA